MPSPAPRSDLARTAGAAAAALLVASGAGADAHSRADGPDRPNVVVVFTDDIGLGDISHLNPESGSRTPHIDALADRGVTFRHAHSTASVCAPSRYAFLTGNYVFRGRLPKGTWAHCSPSQILEDQDTLADVLRAHDYRTAFIGKLHLGAQFHSTTSSEPASTMVDADLARPMFDGPIDHGFDTTLTLLAGIQNSPYAYFKDDRLARWDADTNTFVHFETDAKARAHLVHDATAGKKIREDEIRETWDEHYVMDNYVSAQAGPLLTHAALEFIGDHLDEHADRPFFLHFCTEAAHSPYTPPTDLSPDDPDAFDQEGRWPVDGQTPTRRADMVYESDAIVGAIVELLEERGELDDTIIIYTSDNGGARHRETWDDPKYFLFKYGYYGGNRVETGWHRDGEIRNGQGLGHDGRPLRGSKGDIYEGGHRVPLVISWPGGMAPIEDPLGPDALVGLHDVFATLGDLADFEIPSTQAQDSVSFADVVRGHRSGVRTHLLVQGRLPMTFEQTFAEELAEERGWTPTRDERGFIVGFEEEEAPKARNLGNWSDNRAIGRAIYRRTDDRLWKLVFVTDNDGTSNPRPVELFELIADPDESENLIERSEHEQLAGELIEQFRATVETGDRRPVSERPTASVR
ncbi:MAG: sulfatase-like hydrolase/transferase [Planctomycetota bacterium]